MQRPAHKNEFGWNPTIVGTAQPVDDSRYGRVSEAGESIGKRDESHEENRSEKEVEEEMRYIILIATGLIAGLILGEAVSVLHYAIKIKREEERNNDRDYKDKQGNKEGDSKSLSSLFRKSSRNQRIERQ